MRGTDLLKWKKLLVEHIFKYKYVLLIVLAGILLLLLPPLWGEKESVEDTGSQQEQNSTFSTAELEDRLERILSQIQGVGEAQVVLTLKSGPQDILAQNVDTAVDDRGTQSELASVILSQGSGREEAVVVQQLSPQYQGALVVCSGGDDPETRLRLVEAVSALTGLGADKISICKGK